MTSVHLVLLIIQYVNLYEDDKMKKPDVKVEIIEDEQTCANCAIRYEQRKMLKENDSGLMAHSARYCVPCVHQKNRALLDRMMGMLPMKAAPVVDNWRPVK